MSDMVLATMRRGAMPKLPYSAEVEYLESTGTQYLNLGPSIDFSEIVIDIANYGDAGATQYVLGCGSGSRQYLEITASGYWGAEHRGTVAWERGKRVSVRCDHLSGIYVDGTRAFDTNSLDIIGYKEDDLLVSRTNGYGLPCKNRIYGMSLSGSRAIRVIPVLDLSGRPAMYDCVSGRFFYNQGSGEFAVGPALQTFTSSLGVLMPQKEAKPTARDYVQDGLVAMWDGIENAGWGVHDAAPDHWVDLAGGFNLFPDSPSRVPQCNEDSFGPFRDANGGDIGYFVTRSLPPKVAEMVGTKTGAVECVWKDAAINYNNGRTYSVFENNFFQVNQTFTLEQSWGVANTYKIPIELLNSCIVSDGASVSWYSKGELISSVFGGSDAVTPTNGLSIGRYLEAKICALRIYNRALTSAEITANYAVDKARFGLA